jgi:hypothetical protein
MLSIDLSAAYDTPPRQGLLDAIIAATPEDTDLHSITSLLMNNTTLRVRVDGELSPPIKSNIGTPQGDGFSPKLFNTYFEYVMKSLRPQFPKRNLTDKLFGLPPETQYADDLDFLSTSKLYLENIEQILASELPKAQLRMNPGKTQWTHIQSGSMDWRNVKVLGSLLDPKYDLQRRMKLSSAAFGLLYPIFKHSQIHYRTKLRIYNAYIAPILTYNCATAGLTQQVYKHLDAYHRRHLRCILGYY